MKIADLYFRSPVSIDLGISGAVSFLHLILLSRGFMPLPKADAIYSNSSDLMNVNLTTAGFVLTLLTIIITFSLSASQMGSGGRAKKFVDSDLYPETVRHLKICVMVLVSIALVIYAMRAYFGADVSLHLCCTLSLMMLACTLWRILFILSQIVGLK